jgi:hypothetical protein
MQTCGHEGIISGRTTGKELDAWKDFVPAVTSGTDEEECRLMGFKNPVRTSQETHHFSATEPSHLILCTI